MDELIASMEIPSVEQKSKLKNFLNNIDFTAIGYNSLEFHPFDLLRDELIGICWCYTSGIYIKNNLEGWGEKWQIIASDWNLNAVVVDLTTEDMKVISTIFNNGKIYNQIIADSLDAFKETISSLKELSINRDSPSLIEQNPIHQYEKDSFLLNFKKLNKESSVAYWENFLTGFGEDIYPMS